MQLKRSTITRRNALKIMALAGVGSLLPVRGLADTESDLADAQTRLNEAQSKLDGIAREYETLSAAQSKTLDELAQVEDKIEEVKKRVKKLQDKLDKKQKELAANVSEEYKDGSNGVVGLVLGATSIEDLISKLYYHGKVTEDQARLIDETKSAKEAVEEEKAELEKQRKHLAEVSATQEEQLEAMRAKQAEAQEVINGLDKEVRDLIAKRDAEILAAQQEAERARKEREAAERAEAERAEARRKAAAESAAASEKAATTSSNDYSNDETSDEPSDEPSGSEGRGGNGTGSAARVINACYSTPSPGLGLCAGWCSMVMENAGYGYVGGNANDMYAEYCYSSNRADLKPGMAVAVSSHPHTSAGRIYGHIGMYVGDGMMMDNVGEIRTISVNEWCDYYGGTVSPRWGWLKGIVLS